LYLLRRLKYSLSKNYLKMSYHALIQCHISYCILLWGGSTRAKDVFLWQKKAIRIVFNISARESCRGYFKQFGILTIASSFIYQSLIFVRSHLNDFDTGQSVDNHDTRNKHLLIKPRIRLTRTNRTYVVQGLKFLNILPLGLRNLPLSKFQHEIKKILIQIEGYTFDEIETNLRNL